ncbi:DUF3291 domain-containing protein [candidate division KSB1 bacterium]|nr:DUF3291 domain-containing protein [candidate division KSB1 bacterium]
MNRLLGSTAPRWSLAPSKSKPGHTVTSIRFTLQHTDKPQEFVQNAYNALNPGGGFFCIEPVYDKFAAFMIQQIYHLIHANVAITRAPLDGPIMAGFVNQVDEINALARESPGFVAQPTPADEGQVFSGRALMNLSIWESVESLDRFTHQGRHALALERRAEWFEQYDGPNYVLYWAPAGHIPTEAEVKQRIDYLAKYGPTPFAFIFEQRFTVEEMLAFKKGARTF